jgi:flagellar biosynthesis protein FliP
MSVGMNAKTDDLITRFLLGELSEEERTEVEKRFLADNEFFEEVLSAEDALIDQYLLGQLNEEQLERAKTLFQSSPRQKREVEFTKELIATVREANLEKPTSPARQTTFLEAADKTHPGEKTTSATAEIEDSARKFPLIPAGLQNLTPRFTAIVGLAILLVCFSLVFWIFYLYSQKRDWEAQHRNSESERLAVERSNQEARKQLSEEIQGKEDLSRQLEFEKEKRAQAEELVAQLQARKPERITSILLNPTALERGGSSKPITLKADTKRIQFQLALEEPQRYRRYSVLITTFDGRIVWSKDSLDPSQIKRGRLTSVLPSSLFGYEDYRIELKGLTDNGDYVHVADYIFRVRK